MTNNDLQNYIENGGLDNIVPGGQVSYNIVSSSSPVTVGSSSGTSSGSMTVTGTSSGVVSGNGNVNAGTGSGSVTGSGLANAIQSTISQALQNGKSSSTGRW